MPELDAVFVPDFVGLGVTVPDADLDGVCEGVAVFVPDLDAVFVPDFV